MPLRCSILPVATRIALRHLLSVIAMLDALLLQRVVCHPAALLPQLAVALLASCTRVLALLNIWQILRPPAHEVDISNLILEVSKIAMLRP